MSDQYVQPRLLPSVTQTPASLSTNGFTLGRFYRVVQTHEPGRAVTVCNDRGHLRTVIPDGSACAHIVRSFTRSRMQLQEPVGCFVSVKKFIETQTFQGVQYPRWPDNPRSPIDTSMVQCVCGRLWNMHEAVRGYCPTPEYRGL